MAEVDTATRPAPVVYQEPAAQLPATRQQVQTLEQARQRTVGDALAAIIPTSIGEMVTLATHLARSKAVPYSYRGNPDTVLTAIMAGMEIGLTPIRALNNFTLIGGNLAMKADLTLATIRKSGLLAAYDEGFEIKGKTDKLLGHRLDRFPGIYDRIAAHVEPMPDGKPYGWCVMQRAGEDQPHVRVFSWADADLVNVPKKQRQQRQQRPGGGVDVTDDDDQDDLDEGPEDPNNRNQRTMKLHEKHNYRFWPGDMYPKRARVRVAQFLFSDVTAGIPAVEAIEGGQIIEAEYVEAGAEPGVPDEGVEALLADIRNTDPELATGIEAGFRNLDMNPGKQLAHLNKWKDDPAGGLDWLRKEYLERSGRAQDAKPQPPAQRKKVAKKKAKAKAKPQAAAKPAAPAQPAITSPQQQQGADPGQQQQPAATQQPEHPQGNQPGPEQGPKGPARNVGGSF